MLRLANRGQQAGKFLLAEVSLRARFVSMCLCDSLTDKHAGNHYRPFTMHYVLYPEGVVT